MAVSTATSEPAAVRTTRRARYVMAVAVLPILVVALVGYRAWHARRTAPTSTRTEFTSATELEERHGLAVRLIGVTAGGGMIDFRLKILDPLKAQRFLQDPANLPGLVVAESGQSLMGTEGLGDDIRWEEGIILFVVFSNTGGAIQPGTPVIVEFGEVQLEPMPAQ